MLLFCFVQFICNLTASYIDVVLDYTNYWVYKLNTILSLIFILFLFGKYLVPDIKKVSNLVILTLVIVNVITIYYGDGITYYNSYSAALNSIVIVGYCLFYFYTRLIMPMPEESVPSTSIFWCVVGIFTYYTGAFFIFITYKYFIDTDAATISTLWRFHNFLLLICCLYISYGVLCKSYRIT